MTAKKVSFEDALTDLLQAQGIRCPICDSPIREKIEAARKKGARMTMIGLALQQSGVLDPNISSDAAQRRVAQHFKAHVSTKEMTDDA